MGSINLTLLITLAILPIYCNTVKTGLDNIPQYSQLFTGKRIGIITNHTAYSSRGQYIVDVLRNVARPSLRLRSGQAWPCNHGLEARATVRVTALFTPEHGIAGIEQAGKAIESGIDSRYNLPVYSLYGKTHKPTSEMLKDVDILVFDIQDIGARFYTYIWTMSLAMEAAAECGKEFIVLDRPNPINGANAEGNILEPHFASFVGLHPIPIRHGMTVGELAAMFNGQGWLKNGVRADLVVVPMTGWRRSMWYDQTGLSFIKPSPNIPDLETAAIYPGLCLLEGTNVSEGRGTEMPFRQFGAPWIDSKALAIQLNRLNLPGLRFLPTDFTPTDSAAIPSGMPNGRRAVHKYKDQKCHGVKIIVTNRDLLEPYYSGIMIVNELFRTYPHAFRWKTNHFAHLCGTTSVRKAITTHASIGKLRKDWQAELKSFLKIRQKYLMYPD